ncbi:hypothetical protein QN219_29330 [Sinorhizobium sp. 7-81]|uniref:hypothetical protein n=1 Tax=Sinorhizobium sp. 8-89 TaxID=3049089 RepID=UPI0024C3CD57|nr:hypothetical protein [Sinorhizobium sp. 8-89]MDK1494084.1 hypothetical protein [Sinorhizobium sp. 8-89]
MKLAASATKHDAESGGDVIMRQELDAREYKLLLNPAKFDAPLSKASANAFWHREIEQIIRECFNSSHAVENAFDELLKRNVQYWDTHDCALASADLTLRSRVDASAGRATVDEHEIILKLRMADFFVVADTRLDRSDGDKKPQFEEDIAPYEGRPPDPAAAVVSPAKPSIRSRYALTTKRHRHWDESSRTEGRLRRLFPAIEDLLKRPLGDDDALVGGPEAYEFAARGAKVGFGQGVVGEFTLTLWHFGAVEEAPAVAEVSFKCDTPGGEMSGKAARMALELFNALQTDLGDYVNTTHSSKTALALPAGCASG